MSTTHVYENPTPTNFKALLDSALAEYTKQTGTDLRNHPLAHKIESCDTPDSLLTIFEEQAQAFDEFKNGNHKLIKWLQPVVIGLHALSTRAAVRTGVGLAFPPATAIFTGISVLLSAAKDARASYDALTEVFECIDNFLRRLIIYTKIPPTPAMTEMLVNIMVELLSVLALATKQIHQGRFKKYAKKLFGEKDIESVLQRLDRLTLEESKTTTAQTFDVVSSLVNNMHIVMEDGKTSTSDIRQTLVLMQELAMNANKTERNQLRHWLSAPDPWINQNIARKVHHRGTTTWFTQGNAFKHWKSTGSLLWVHGLAGSGKSVLCSTVIEDVRHMCQTGLSTLAIFYFDFRDTAKQDARSLLSSLLVQLCDQSDTSSQVLFSLYTTHADGSRQPSEDALMECLKNMLKLPRQGAQYIIIDALDECPNSYGLTSPRAEVLEIVRKLVELRLPHVHFFITSRLEIDIRNVLGPLANHVSLHNQIGQNQDIIDYVNSVVHSHPKMRRWRDEDKQLVIDTLVERAGGMFRWIYCQLETLSRCFPQSIRRALDELPETLDETYERTLQAIDKEKREFAFRLFQCLAVSIRPLLVEEIAELFAIQPDVESIPRLNYGWRPENAEESILSTCSTLVAVVNVNDDQVVQFSHFSVREYLTSNRIEYSKNVSRFHVHVKSAHLLLARVCLSVLLQLDDRIDETKVENFPLASYAAQHWVDHAQFENVSLDIIDRMECLFDEDKPHFAAWIWVYDIDQDDPHFTVCPEQPDTVPLYYAALCGFRDIAERLLDTHPQHVNSRGGYWATPLHAAVSKGHLNVALLLLERGADVESRDDELRTPIHVASDHGYADVVRALIQRGADPNARKTQSETPLFGASLNARLETARVLLEHGAGVNYREIDGWTALHIASQNGHDHVARLLLDRGADPNATNRDSCTPLHLASFNGNMTVARILLKRGAIVDARDKWEGTPLHSAVLCGRMDIVRLLLDWGALVNARNEDGRAALHIAAGMRHGKIVELLLEHGADPHARDRAGDTPSQIAARKKFTEVSRLLMRRAGGRNNYI